jgi:hypothetical protein
MKKAILPVMLAFGILILFSTCKKEDEMKGDRGTIYPHASMVILSPSGNNGSW